MKDNNILLIKPPDRYLENEFVYQQLGPHYLQSFLMQYEIPSDILVLYEDVTSRENRRNGSTESFPIYGDIVIESNSKFLRNALAYIFEVLPMSPLLASAMVKISG